MESGMDSVLLADNPCSLCVSLGPKGPLAHALMREQIKCDHEAVIQVSNPKIHLDSPVLVHTRPVSLIFLLGEV